MARYTREQLMEAAIEKAFEEHGRNIRDRQWYYDSKREEFRSQFGLELPEATEGDVGEIARIIRTNGGWWARVMRKRGYSEAKGDAWCGLFWGHCFMNVGEYLDHGICVDVHIDPDIAEHVLPSTLRINSSNFWKKVPGSPRIDGTLVKPEDVQRGDIACVNTGKNKSYGDHYVMVLGPAVDVDGVMRYPTIEGNGYGLLGDGTWGEGVVVRDDRHAVLMREVQDIRRVYRFTEEHFEGSHL